MILRAEYTMIVVTRASLPPSVRPFAKDTPSRSNLPSGRILHPGRELIPLDGVKAETRDCGEDLLLQAFCSFDLASSGI